MSVALAVLDPTGAASKTIAHLRENGRIVVCALSGSPKIVRLPGRVTVVPPGDPGFEALLARFPRQVGVRCVIESSSSSARHASVTFHGGAITSC